MRAIFQMSLLTLFVSSFFHASLARAASAEVMRAFENRRGYLYTKQGQCYYQNFRPLAEGEKYYFHFEDRRITLYDGLEQKVLWITCPDAPETEPTPYVKSFANLLKFDFKGRVPEFRKGHRENLNLICQPFSALNLTVNVLGFNPVGFVRKNLPLRISDIHDESGSAYQYDAYALRKDGTVLFGSSGFLLAGKTRDLTCRPTKAETIFAEFANPQSVILHSPYSTQTLTLYRDGTYSHSSDKHHRSVLNQLYLFPATYQVTIVGESSVTRKLWIVR